MRINKIARAIAVAKRDADLDAEYEEAMEEIEAMKKKCKALEYAGHATGLVNNLIGDIPDIPLVTDKVKVITSGVAAVTHAAEFGMNIASTAMECDDWNFEEIKAIMEKRFSEIDRKLDKMTQAMEKVTEMVTETLHIVEMTREEMKWGFKNVLATLKNREIQSILSRINKFSRYFEEKKDEISKLPADQFVFRLKEKDGILDYLKKVRMPEGLHSDLFELMDKDNNFALPEDANDTKAFQALYALFYGTQTYAAVMFFLLKQHSYLAEYYYQKGQDKDFNIQIDTLITTFNEFKTSLTGSKGLINEVVKTLDEVKDKYLIEDVQDKLYTDISNRVDALKELKTNITGMALNIITDVPQSVDGIKFTEPFVLSNYGHWDDKSRVKYAVQLRKDGAYSKFSEWTDPEKIDGKANPFIVVPRDEKGRERLVFRKFNDDKPQLAIILTKSPVEVRDLDRDLYEAARSKDQNKTLEYIPRLFEANANIHTVFENRRSVMHAAAESGNGKIAYRYLLDKKQNELLDARDSKGFTPMHIAADTKNSGFVNFLITHNADVNAQTTIDKLAPLHLASKKGYINAVAKLLASDKIDVNIQDKSGYTPLHYAVRGTVRTIEWLLENDKILVNAKSKFGLTPFHLAVMKGDKSICDALLRSGKVEVNAGNKDNLTALHFAAMEGNLNMIQYLLSHKKQFEEVDINLVTSNNNWTPLYTAIYFKHEDAALEILKNSKTDINITSKENVTPLQLSVATAQVKAFDEILKKVSNIDAKSKDGFTALHLAALRPEVEFITKLLDKNASIDIKTDYGSTPLHLAAESDKRDQIMTLINRGANMKMYDDKNFLPFHYFVQNTNLDALRATVSKDPSMIDSKTVEGKKLVKYCLDFIFAKVYHYHKNKDSIEYRKYKNMQPLEIFDKKGYYEIIRIVQNDPSEEDVVNGTIHFMNQFSIECIERETNPSEKQCGLSDLLSKRSIANVEPKWNKVSPLLISMSNSFGPISNLGDLKYLDLKSPEGSNAFSKSINTFGQTINTHGMLLLMDLFVRKLTNEKSKRNVRQPLSTLESQAAALKIVDKVGEFVDSVSDVPAEELIDLAKLHADVYKAIEGGNSNMIMNLLCIQLMSIIDPEKMESFFSNFSSNVPGTAPENENSINTIKEHCLSKTSKGNAN